jgi:N-glycosylase/DNA lyase
VDKEVWQLKQDDERLFYRPLAPASALNSAPAEKKRLERLKDLFRLSTNLVDLYAQWSSRDPNFKRVCVDFPGVRMMRQEPVENVFSFICSSNNNIERSVTF